MSDANSNTIKELLQEYKNIDLSPVQIFFNRALYNYESNALEGNTLKLEEVVNILSLVGDVGQDKLHGRLSKDVAEIIGHDAALKYMLSYCSDGRPITENFIRELNKLSLVDEYSSETVTEAGKTGYRTIVPGKYKSVPNHVLMKNGEVFSFTSPTDTPLEMQRLVEWMNSVAVSIDNFVEVAAVLHYKFIRIHPFDDGNGRVSRLLMNYVLGKFGCPLVCVSPVFRGDYFAALEAADAGNLKVFVEFIERQVIWGFYKILNKNL